MPLQCSIYFYINQVALHLSETRDIPGECSDAQVIFLSLDFLPTGNTLTITGENRGFDRCILDWTNQCKSRLPLVAKSAFLQTATAAHISGPIYETFLCSGSLKPGSFGYLGQTALALIGPI